MGTRSRVAIGANRSSKIWAWDLETSHLTGNQGFILCASVVDVASPGKVKTFRLDKYKGWKHDPTNDSRLVADLVRYLGAADAWVTYYGSGFDVPFLYTRVAYWRARGVDIDYPCNVPHVDLWRTVRRKLKLNSNKLQKVSELLGRGDKTPLDLPVWLKAAGGHKQSMVYIVEHCERDAVILARTYLDLRPIIAAHPHMGLLAGGTGLSCASCGSAEVQKRGTYVTEASRRQRFQCTSCGRWGSTPLRADNNNKEGGTGVGAKFYRRAAPATTRRASSSNGGDVGKKVH